VVLSRKAVLEREFAEQKKETLTKLREGARLPGVVKNITDYGVFVDLGGIDGLLHITDISWGRVNHPSEHFSIGDEIEIVVLKFDPETERVSLGYKQRSEDPWSLVDKKYPLGSRVHGKVVSLVDYGAFVELEEGVEGLIRGVVGREQQTIDLHLVYGRQCDLRRFEAVDGPLDQLGVLIQGDEGLAISAQLEGGGRLGRLASQRLPAPGCGGRAEELDPFLRYAGGPDKV
jgi:predicted RNA-binding protein with RPS1 domain